MRNLVFIRLLALVLGLGLACSSCKTAPEEQDPSGEEGAAAKSILTKIR